MIREITPYLFFGGDARAAIRLYEEALGAKTEGLMTYADMPGPAPDPATKDRVLHAKLCIGAASILVSDVQPGQTVSAGTRVEITLTFDDVDEMQRRFDALAEGGKVGMAIHDAFWGDTFGTLNDAFGIGWMFICTPKGGSK